jgi:molybdopterin synthase sulfur carrier subunit
MQLLYFGWVKQRIGVDKENVALPADVTDVRGLIGWLNTRGPKYQAALKDLASLRVAVNQELTDLDATLRDGDEVALFPPMTGG